MRVLPREVGGTGPWTRGKRVVFVLSTCFTFYLEMFCKLLVSGVYRGLEYRDV